VKATVFESTDYTEEEYIELFRQFERRIGYHDGRIELVAEVPSPHNDLATNLLVALAKNVRGCKPHDSDQAVSIPKFSRYVYPDLSFSCGGPNFTDKKRLFLTNPALIVEVISGSSGDRDEINKFNWSFSISTVKEYILVNSLKKEVNSYLRKDEKTWIMQRAC
jgi:Uma2 family endonuclease